MSDGSADPPPIAVLMYGPFHGTECPAGGDTIVMENHGIGPHVYDRTGRTTGAGVIVYEYRHGNRPRPRRD